MTTRADAMRRSQLLALNSFFPFMALFFLGWAIIGQLIPPPSPGLDAQGITAFLMPHRERYLACMLLSMLSTAFLMPFSAVIVGQVARIEDALSDGKGPRVWTYAALMAAAGNIVSFTFPLMFFCVALFRPDREPALVQLASDFGWLPFLAMASPYVTLPICVAITGLIDPRPHPVFPRWYCYLTIASTIAILPACMIPFFPRPAWFAWNSVFGWWVPFSDVFGWMLLAYWFCRGAILRGDEA